MPRQSNWRREYILGSWSQALVHCGGDVTVVRAWGHAVGWRDGSAPFWQPGWTIALRKEKTHQEESGGHLCASGQQILDACSDSYRKAAFWSTSVCLPLKCDLVRCDWSSGNRRSGSSWHVSVDWLSMSGDGAGRTGHTHWNVTFLRILYKVFHGMVCCGVEHLFKSTVYFRSVTQTNLKQIKGQSFYHVISLTNWK